MCYDWYGLPLPLGLWSTVQRWNHRRHSVCDLFIWGLLFDFLSTVHFGQPTEHMRRCFTLVLKVLFWLTFRRHLSTRGISRWLSAFSQRTLLALDWTLCLTNQIAHGIRKAFFHMRQQRPPHLGMIGIHPSDFIGIQHRDVNELRLNWTQRHGFKRAVLLVVEVMWCMSFSRDAEVLDANAEVTLLVVARLIGGQHAQFEALQPVSTGTM